MQKTKIIKTEEKCYKRWNIYAKVIYKRKINSTLSYKLKIKLTI